MTDPTSFWQGQAEAIHWQTPFHTVCDFTKPPFARWFVGGKTILCYNAVDRHLETRADQPAIFFHSSESGTEKVITYRKLHREVNRFAAVLKKLGINKGDRLVIYLPMIPEAAYAIHSVVFAGFAIGYLKNMRAETKKSVYEQVVYDSDTEATFADQLEKNTAVKVYAKLPGWFTLPTPLGTYNPDWAVLIEKDGAERLYFVVETKSSLFTDDLRDKESAKIECGMQFKRIRQSQKRKSELR